MLTEME